MGNNVYHYRWVGYLTVSYQIQIQIQMMFISIKQYRYNHVEWSSDI